MSDAPRAEPPSATEQLLADANAIAVWGQWELLEGVVKQTAAMCLMAIRQNAEALRYVQPQLQTEELCIAAIKGSGLTPRRGEPQAAQAGAQTAI